MTTAFVDDAVIEEIVERVRRRFSMKPKVAIAGFGKSGKSSLFNAIYGERVAKVSMKTDETTPDDMLTKERFGIDFTDTPGFGTEKFSLDTIAALLDGQHVVVHVLNGAASISAEDHRLHANLGESHARRVTVVNKVDLLDESEQADVRSSVREKLGLERDAFLFISAKRGTNIPSLVQRITELLPEAMQDAFVAQQQADLQLKERRIRKLIYSKAALAGVVGAVPIPVADIAVLTPMQIAMVAGVGYFHGVEVTKDRAVEFLTVVGAGMGLREAARQLAKLIPGWGSAISAAVAFAGTVALGESAHAWFKSQMKLAPDELREVFKKAASRAKTEYEERPRAAAPTDAENAISSLRAKHAAGEISDEELALALAKIT